MTVQTEPGTAARQSTGGRSRPGTAVIAAVLVVVLVVAVGLWYWLSNRDGVEFKARFTSSVGVYAGSDVRILGVPVGSVDSVTPHGEYVTIGMHLDPDVSVRADTAAVIISPNLVSDRYIQLTGAYTGGPKLADGATIGIARTRTPVELDELTRNLTSLTDALGPNGANANGALSRLLNTGADNLGGNGKKLNETIARLSESGRTLDSAKGDIFVTISRLARFTTTLKDHDAALGSANQNLASVSQTLSDDRQSFSEAINELGSALTLVQRFVRDNRAGLTSNVEKLNTVGKTLAGRRASLAKALRAAPLLLQNFLNAYDPDRNLLRGRANLNELTVWANGGSSSSNASSSSVSSGSSSTNATSSSARAVDPAGAAGAPPALLPSIGTPVSQP